ncbi:MAG TPA: Vms1/Ankzf1 family peptidyl-tRNA hydrolase, partial [Solirubrobacteraceae bacterium]
VEPLVAGHDFGRCCVTLVNRRVGRVFAGHADQLGEEERIKDRVHSRTHGGGWSQANYQRSSDEEAEAHLRRVSSEVYRSWREQPFQTLVLGGPVEDVARFEEVLHNDLRSKLRPERLDLDVEVAHESDVRAAMAVLLGRAEQERKQATLEELQARRARGERAAVGLADTLEALTERRGETLVLTRTFRAPGGRCPQCGLLSPAGAESCPADGTRMQTTDNIREAAVQSAVLQDAEILVIEDPPDTPEALVPVQGIGALLRF